MNSYNRKTIDTAVLRVGEKFSIVISELGRFVATVDSIDDEGVYCTMNRCQLKKSIQLGKVSEVWCNKPGESDITGELKRYYGRQKSLYISRKET